MIRAALAAALSIALAACASTSLETAVPRETGVGAPTASDTQNSSGVARPPDPRILMVDLAKSMLGQPYRFGGAAPGGFDCSGLVEYAAGGAGIHMPRTALEQFGIGKPVARGEVHEGDLVFMHLAHKELHVGIALDGQRFIHAPSSGGHVRIDSLAARPYSKGFMGARRMLTAR